MIGVLYLKSCRPSIFSHAGERESDQNNRITGNSPKYQHEYAENDFQIEKKTFSPSFAAPVRLRLVSKIHKKIIEFFHKSVILTVAAKMGENDFFLNLKIIL